ncbi:hypothetical protein [Amycolatopsis sp. NPDC102389]
MRWFDLEPPHPEDYLRAVGRIVGMRAQNAQWWPPSGGPEVLR